jgi:hypothetical protein
MTQTVHSDTEVIFDYSNACAATECSCGTSGGSALFSGSVTPSHGNGGEPNIAAPLIELLQWRTIELLLANQSKVHQDRGAVAPGADKTVVGILDPAKECV